MFSNRIASLLNIQFPIVQAGMVWTSGWRLASAVSNAGGLGVIGAGSMYPEILDEHITKCKAATLKPFAVNLPLLYPEIDKHLEVIIKHKVRIVVTSAGNPSRFTGLLKDHGISVMHVVSNSRFAEKAERSGCDAVIAEGFEAGGHNGREETTTMILVPLISNTVSIPVIAAGGIATGSQMLAAMILGADGVQVGSRFVASSEASSHMNFKGEVVNSGEGDTILTLKELTPVRLLKNNFFEQIKAANERHASRAELEIILGKGRAKRGMFEGDINEGELEIGQVSALINKIKPAADILQEIWRQFNEALENAGKIKSCI